MFREYVEAYVKIGEDILSGEVSRRETSRIIKADNRWSHDRKKYYKGKIRKGEVYQIEFGKNFELEMSYEHRGLVIGVHGRLLYVLPIFSYIPEKHEDAFHPVYNPESKSNLFLLKADEYEFVEHDSVLRLNLIQAVSTGRIVHNSPRGYMSPSSETYKQIESLVMKKYFPEFVRKMEVAQRELELLKHTNVEGGTAPMTFGRLLDEIKYDILKTNREAYRTSMKEAGLTDEQIAQVERNRDALTQMKS